MWLTWIIRDLGEGVLGHAHLGKGVIEVALGDYSCDGSFQLYDVNTVETIMTHELGHSIGLPHTNDKSNIMYPSIHSFKSLSMDDFIDNFNLLLEEYKANENDNSNNNSIDTNRVDELKASIEKSKEFAKFKKASPLTFKPKLLANNINKVASQLLLLVVNIS